MLKASESSVYLFPQLGDAMGLATAQMNVSDLRKVLGIPNGDLSPDSQALVDSLGDASSPGSASGGIHRYRVRRQSMGLLDLIKVW